MQKQKFMLELEKLNTLCKVLGLKTIKDYLKVSKPKR